MCNGRGRGGGGAACWRLAKFSDYFGQVTPQKLVFSSNLGHFERKVAENCQICTHDLSFSANFLNFWTQGGGADAPSPALLSTSLITDPIFDISTSENNKIKHTISGACPGGGSGFPYVPQTQSIIWPPP